MLALGQFKPPPASDCFKLVCNFPHARGLPSSLDLALSSSVFSSGRFFPLFSQPWQFLNPSHTICLNKTVLTEPGPRRTRAQASLGTVPHTRAAPIRGYVVSKTEEVSIGRCTRPAPADPGLPPRTPSPPRRAGAETRGVLWGCRQGEDCHVPNTPISRERLKCRQQPDHV